MAVKDWTAGTLNNDHKSGMTILTWVLANGDSGQPFESGLMTDVTAQIFGTFGAAGSVTLQGSNDPRVPTDYAAGASNAQWVTIEDNLGNAWTKTAAGGDIVLQSYRYLRPLCTAGDGTTALTVIIKAVGDR